MDDDLLQRISAFDQCVVDRDHDAAQDLLDESFALVLVHPATAVVDRQQWLGMLPDYVVHSWDVQERLTHVDGDEAAVLQRVHMQATVLGEDRSGPFVLTDIWRRHDGRWRLWRRHSTPLTAGVMPGS